MRKFLRRSFLTLLLALTYAVHVYHLGVYPSPTSEEIEARALNAKISGSFIDKSQFGIHQLVLWGNNFNRGYTEGKLAAPLIQAQEKSLIGRLDAAIPNPLLLRAFTLSLMRWFYGIDSYFDLKDVQEMAGISRFASNEFNYLADPLTRQIAYHGLHEVGQMMVDQTGDDVGCTVLAAPLNPSQAPSSATRWLIGRNFDFEGGEIFDREKILKWVFPEDGYAFVSVVWAGMVGAVTGVNQEGVYISINAAGSKEFARYGTPSTLVLRHALQHAKTADEAVNIIKSAQMFITDLFVVSDRTTGKLYRIEKSPKTTEVIELQEPSVVTNHLISDHFAKDDVNIFRRDELTSQVRFERGTELLRNAKLPVTEQTLLGYLRDKGEASGQKLALGNRRAIDALIAAHSVIYNEQSNVLWVGTGPSVSGKFVGFDLAQSFAARNPIKIGELPADREVSEKLYQDVHTLRAELSLADALIRKQHCVEARAHLDQTPNSVREKNYEYHYVLGNLAECEKDLPRAKQEWSRALDLHPAYAKEIKNLKRKLADERPI